MSKLPFPDDVRAFLSRPNPAVMATLRKSGAPITVATWYLLEDDDRVLLTLDDTRTRLQHLKRDPRIALTVTDPENWYTHVSFQGEVVEIASDTGLAGANKVSQHYTGHDYPDQVSPRTNVWVRISDWHGWGAHKDDLSKRG
ncbi:TIGR03618 family F420-dependent PPOX class oxidoreductase [Nocardioides bruguierae]|uniref:TIGR03618 family F420-dependent PPOX class oxidoreductase n=1 Tax=Nocardioides bruguierae TaxID=2945102 RepID=A0A9X2D3L1_9ACTN|nr:TIGR03618 family F420-dependent PPOX class oxidoreductase [Nocardioides bruguierae]MCL8024251.1 TIGR03618 family F420-dependent PPOX class oxidoreductase [Nocardioides bruguierae]MCM0618673.1 TIGR03618 family F420-dependent PPOX class oxidoreductase [Nocardioides bruguierae]